MEGREAKMLTAMYENFREPRAQNLAAVHLSTT